MSNKHSDELLFRAVQVFLQNPSLKKEKIAEQLNKEFGLTNSGSEISRQTVYDIVAKALEQGHVRLIPPLDAVLKRKLVEKFKLESESVQVIPSVKENSAYVSAVAAERVVELIRAKVEKDPKKRNDGIGLGLGAGSATLAFCRHLTGLFRSNPPPCKLKLIALSSGCPPGQPQFSPAGFFTLFDDHHVLKRVALFTEPLVKQSEFNTIRTRPWLKEAFESAKDVDIIVSSMGYVHDSHDKLMEFLTQCEVDTKSLLDAGWVGNLQYRPYSKTGPIEGRDDDWRAVTLFELTDLQRFVQTGEKTVVLIARQCAVCGMTKEEALWPLMNPDFRLWSELIVDTATARGLLSYQG